MTRVKDPTAELNWILGRESGLSWQEKTEALLKYVRERRKEAEATLAYWKQEELRIESRVSTN